MQSMDMTCQKVSVFLLATTLNFLLCMKSIIVKFAVALASVAMLALFMWGFAEAFDAEMESHSKEYWERMEEER